MLGGRQTSSMPDDPSAAMDPSDVQLYTIVAALLVIIVVMYLRMPGMITPEVMEEMEVLPSKDAAKAQAHTAATTSETSPVDVPLVVPTPAAASVPAPAAEAKQTPAVAKKPEAEANKAKDKDKDKKEAKGSKADKHKAGKGAEKTPEIPTRIAITVSSDDEEVEDNSGDDSPQPVHSTAFGTQSKFQLPVSPPYTKASAKSSVKARASKAGNAVHSNTSTPEGEGARRRRVSFDAVVAPDVIAMEVEKKQNEQKAAKAEKRRLAEKAEKEAEAIRKEEFLKQLAASEAAARLEAEERAALAAEQAEELRIAAEIKEIQRMEDEWEVVDKRAGRNPQSVKGAASAKKNGKKFSVGLASQAPLPALAPPALPEPKPFIITVPTIVPAATSVSNKQNKSSQQEKVRDANASSTAHLNNSNANNRSDRSSNKGGDGQREGHTEGRRASGRGAGRGRSDGPGRGREGRGRGDGVVQGSGVRGDNGERLGGNRVENAGTGGRGGNTSGRGGRGGRGRPQDSQGSELDTHALQERSGGRGKSETRNTGAGRGPGNLWLPHTASASASASTAHTQSSAASTSDATQSPIHAAILTGVKTAVIPISSAAAAPGSNRKKPQQQQQEAAAAASSEVVRAGHSSSFDWQQSLSIEPILSLAQVEQRLRG